MAKIKMSFRLSPESANILKDKPDMTQYVDTAIQLANAQEATQRTPEPAGYGNEVKVELLE